MTGWRSNLWSQGQLRAEPGLGGKCWALIFLPEFLPVLRLVGVERDAYGQAVDTLLTSPPFYSHHANSCLGNLHPMRIGGWHHAWQNRKMEKSKS